MVKIKKKTASSRQPAKRRLSVMALNQKPAVRKGGRRAKNLSIRLSKSNQLNFSFRQFRTNKARRSTRQPQIVITVPFLTTREIAITKRSGPVRQPAQSTPAFWQHLKPAAILPLLIGVAGLTYFGLHLKQPVNIQVAPAGHVLAARTVASPKSMPASTPVKLRIDKIGVDAPIIGLGLASDGSLDTPPGPDMVGWYTNSPTPGQIGPAVIDGHVDWIDNIAVFWRLRELVPGDAFSVDRADGSTATFKVTAIQEFPQDNFPTKDVYGSINYAGIRLITCGGQFSTVTHHYDHNIVVFGSLI